jgi:hypothetical protein
VLGAPFIGQGMERGGREAGGQAAAGGASSKRQLLEGEATRRPFDEGEMKRRGRHVCSLTRGRRGRLVRRPESGSAVVPSWSWKTSRVGRSWATKARRLGRTGPQPAGVCARWVGRRGIEKKKKRNAMTDRAEMVFQAENKEERNLCAKLIFEFLFKDFDSKQRVLNIFKPILN